MEGINQENQNTVKLYECYDHNEEIAIVMELCDENLNTMIINKNQIFTISEIIEILNQLNNSFKIMYENKMAHRDLKPENILVKYKNENDKNNYIIKLSDYGEAKKLSMSKKVCLKYSSQDILFSGSLIKSLLIRLSKSSFSLFLKYFWP